MITLIKGGHIVNEGRVIKADIIVKDDKIAELSSNPSPLTPMTLSLTPQTVTSYLASLTTTCISVSRD
jgi:dihydroorotase-like cyclic amidohydrolase